MTREINSSQNFAQFSIESEKASLLFTMNTSVNWYSNEKFGQMKIICSLEIAVSSDLASDLGFSRYDCF